MGLFFVGLAILGWGVADFLIQRSARKLGDWEALFFVTLFASIVLAPFVYPSFAGLGAFDWLVLGGTSVIILVASLLDFDALRVGKMSVIEPIYAMEVIVAIALATLIVGEVISTTQFLLVIGIILGVILVSNKRLGAMHVRLLEKGLLAAVLAAIGMGASNFLFGYAAREMDALIITWFTSIFMTIATFGYLIFVKQSHSLVRDWRHNKWLILGVGLFDVMAWVGYASSTLYLPIGIATGLTEAYIAVAVILGIIFNKEKLRIHQKLGLVLSVAAAIALAFTLEI
jgi:drug/metabolite transporter (DMT)-like permease